MADPKWIKLAKADIGINEIPGPEDNEKIVQYFADVGHDWVRNDETAWCAAFVGSCLERAGIPSTRKLNAKSYLHWGIPTRSPTLGTVVIFNRGNPRSWQGHVAFYIRETDRYVYVLGGNQHNSVNISAQPKWKVRGYRNPPVSRIAKAAVDATGAMDDIDNDPAFDVALKAVLLVEGGFSDHPEDPGGATYRGITLTEYARFKGVQLTDENRQEMLKALLQISDTEIRQVYWRNYWIKTGCNLLPDGLSLYTFDTAVLHGPGIAKKVLQQALGVKDDGVIGQATLEAAEEADAPIALKRFRNIRIERLKKSRNWHVFGEGWTNRIDAMFDEAMRAAGYTIENRRAFQGQEIMPDLPPPPEPDKDKFWLRSMTLWGAIVTIAAVAIPEIGKIAGYQVTAEEINAIGTHGMTILQSVASLIGAVLVVYGRIRAKEPVRFGLRKK